MSIIIQCYFFSNGSFPSEQPLKENDDKNAFGVKLLIVLVGTCTRVCTCSMYSTVMYP